jgi:hypothetical protein
MITSVTLVHVSKNELMPGKIYYCHMSGHFFPVEIVGIDNKFLFSRIEIPEGFFFVNEVPEEFYRIENEEVSLE